MQRRLDYIEKRERMREQLEIEEAPKRTTDNVPGQYNVSLPFDQWSDLKDWDESLQESLDGDKTKFQRFVSNV